MRFVLLALTIFISQCTMIATKSNPGGRTTASSKLILDKSGYAYDPEDRSCDGFPKLMVETMPGTCLGMVLPRDQNSFIKPRTIVQIPQTRNFLVVDMGGWASKKGGLYLLSPSAKGPYEVKVLKSGLDLPHGLALGPDGFFYIGEKSQISKFKLADGQPVEWRLVIGNIPRKKGYMHPLSQFTFDPRNGDLFINSGSPSDHCFAQGTGNYKICPEVESQGNGAIYRVPAAQLKNLPEGGVRYFEVAAVGLRNSMAMAIHPSGFLIQGENSRDFPELEEPYEEINVIDLDNGKGRHYGWPYCYDFHATSPEWLFAENNKDPLVKKYTKPVDCSQTNPASVGDYQAPWALMPPHISPLHMSYYKGPMFQDLFGGKLLVTWHGYQPTGQRLVAYNVDENGRPVLRSVDKGATFLMNQNGNCPFEKPFEPRGGITQYAPYQEVISKWNEVKGVRPKGAPVSFTAAEDGSLWIVEDRENRTILRLARSQNANFQDNCESKKAAAIDPEIPLLAWRSAIKSNPSLERGYQQIQTQLITKNCVGCHGNVEIEDVAKDRFSNLDFLVKNEWFMPKNLERTKVYGAISHAEGYTPMPPIDKAQFYGTQEGERLNKIVANWVNSLPEDVDQSYARIKLKDKRNIRAQPAATAESCGQFVGGDVAYIDPRPKTVVTTGTIQWNKVYLIPGHSRLFKGKCAQPEDGVYYIAK
jgi:glucose/arabinose dehydrogenase